MGPRIDCLFPLVLLSSVSKNNWDSGKTVRFKDTFPINEETKYHCKEGTRFLQFTAEVELWMPLFLGL